MLDNEISQADARRYRDERDFLRSQITAKDQVIEVLLVVLDELPRNSVLRHSACQDEAS